MINFTRLFSLKLSNFFICLGLFLLANNNMLAQTKPTFNLSQGPTLLANGAGAEQIGAKYIYQDIEFSVDGILIDAIVTIVNKVNLDEPNAGSFTIDTALGVDDRFEPTVNTGAGDGYVEWRVEFVLDGTVTDANDVGVRARLETFAIEAIDVDGFEYFEVIVTGSYTIEGGTTPTTELVPSQNGVWTRFQSDADFASGIDEANTEYVVRVDYTNISTINFRNGSSNNSNNRQNSLSFLGEVTFDTENTVVVNLPPVVIDNLGNIISSNSSFSTNVLTGASDPDGNLDPTIVRLIDPSNSANQGVVGSPLVISGVGTYTVNNTGVVIFTPETDYIGDASILFSVEDDLGVSSNQGNLQITVVDECDATASGNTDTDGDNVSDICDDDDDNDGILDSVECNYTIGFTGPFNATNTSFSFTGSGGTGSAVLDAVTVNGNVIANFIVPDSYQEDFVTNNANQVYEVTNNIDGNTGGTSGDNISNPNWNTLILDAFQDRNLNHFQKLDGGIQPSDYYILTYNTPILIAGDSFLFISERGGNNNTIIEAYDIDNNYLGSQIVLAANSANYLSTSTTASNGQVIEIAPYNLSDLGAVGSYIASLRVIPIMN